MTEQTGEAKKRGRLARIGFSLAGRVGTNFGRKAGIGVLKDGYQNAKQIFVADRISPEEARRALRGRYTDGGRERFQAMMRLQGIQEADLAPLEQMRSRQFRSLMGISLFALVVGATIPFLTSDWLIMSSGLIFGLFSLIFLMIGLRHDYAGWQIRNRRFGGIREYLNDRWGR